MHFLQLILLFKVHYYFPHTIFTSTLTPTYLSIFICMSVLFCIYNLLFIDFLSCLFTSCLFQLTWLSPITLPFQLTCFTFFFSTAHPTSLILPLLHYSHSHFSLSFLIPTMPFYITHSPRSFLISLSGTMILISIFILSLKCP